MVHNGCECTCLQNLNQRNGKDQPSAKIEPHKFSHYYSNYFLAGCRILGEYSIIKLLPLESKGQHLSAYCYGNNKILALEQYEFTSRCSQHNRHVHNTLLVCAVN